MINLHNQSESDLQSISFELLNPSITNLNVVYIDKEGRQVETKFDRSPWRNSPLAQSQWFNNNTYTVSYANSLIPNNEKAREFLIFLATGQMRFQRDDIYWVLLSAFKFESPKLLEHLLNQSQNQQGGQIFSNYPEAFLALLILSQFNYKPQMKSDFFQLIFKSNIQSFMEDRQGKILIPQQTEIEAFYSFIQQLRSHFRQDVLSTLQLKFLINLMENYHVGKRQISDKNEFYCKLSELFEKDLTANNIEAYQAYIDNDRVKRLKCQLLLDGHNEYLALVEKVKQLEAELAQRRGNQIPIISPEKPLQKPEIVATQPWQQQQQQDEKPKPNIEKIKEEIVIIQTPQRPNRPSVHAPIEPPKRPASQQFHLPDEECFGKDFVNVRCEHEVCTNCVCNIVNHITNYKLTMGELTKENLAKFPDIKCLANRHGIKCEEIYGFEDAMIMWQSLGNL